MKNICYIILILVLSGCASKPLIDHDDIKVTRDEPSKSCQDMGAIEVRSISLKVDEKKLLEELKTEARKKGADYVKVETLGAQTTAIRGQAYNCN